MKRFFTVILCVSALVVSCGKQSSSGGGGGGERPAVSNTPAITDWAKENKIDDGSQTEAELYELAKQEGQVTVYSISSRITAVKTSFEK